MATNEIGMIDVKAQNGLKGYWRMPEKPAAELCPDGLFITRNLGQIDVPGYVHIVCCGKDIAITRASTDIRRRSRM